MSESDFFRTRLTHSVEAGQIGMTLAEALRDESGNPAFEKTMLMACCLAHDIGHPPLGHDGQSILNKFAEKFSGGNVFFQDNAQNLRIILSIENVYDSEFGLDLTASTLDGVQKYKREKKGYYPEEKDRLNEVVKETGTSLTKRHPVAMMVELADDIAYACHDLEDALRAEYIVLEDFNILKCKSFIEEVADGDEKKISIGHGICEEIFKRLNGASWSEDYSSGRYAEMIESEKFRIYQKRLKSWLIDRFIREATKVFESFRTQLLSLDFEDGDTNLFFEKSASLSFEIKLLKRLVRKKVIEHPSIQFRRLSSKNMMEKYVSRYSCLFEGEIDQSTNEFLSLPFWLRNQIKISKTPADRLRPFLDYISGMTDNFLFQQAESLFRPYELRAFRRSY